jgi:hypothetical protein
MLSIAKRPRNVEMSQILENPIDQAAAAAVAVEMWKTAQNAAFHAL